MHTLLHDLRYSLRQLVKMPGFTLTAVISLALGKSPAVEDSFLSDSRDMTVSGGDLRENFPPNTFLLQVMGIKEEFVQQLGGTLYLLFGAVTLLLLIGCGNVSILLLARATARRHEFAVRAAIGASRRRIVRQLLTESLLLSVSGAVAGVVLATLSLNTIVANLPESSFPHEASIHINLAVLLFSIAAAMGTGVLFGLWPALQLSRTEVSQVMHAGARKMTGGVSGRRAHGALIAGQIALTLILLSGAGAAIEGFLSLAHIPLGYDPHNVMAVGIPLRDGVYTTWAGRAAYFDQLREKVAEVPGVTMAALSTNAMPPSNGFEILGKPSGHDQAARLSMVSQEYFPLLRIPLLEGRIWDQAEDHRGFGRRTPDAVCRTVIQYELKNTQLLSLG